jgi:CrcB protein
VIWVLILVGGAVGGVVRYGVTGVVQRRSAGDFPVGTLAVNLTGALAAGLVVGLVASRGFDDSVVAWLTTGFLGGYTTFSTWMVETNFAAAEGGSAGFRRAVANLAVPLVGGVALAYLGYWFGSMI